MRFLPALVVMALLLPGCAERSVGDRPVDWNSGVELAAHTTGRSHSGAFDARVFPDSEMPLPVRCVAYRGDLQYRSDSCTVMTQSSEHWFPIGDPEWGLMGQWTGRGDDTADDPDPDLPRTLVAYDAMDRPVAFWAGRNHPEASHSTE